MSAITTHVLDTARGCPAGGLGVVLERLGENGSWQLVGHGVTDDDGRVRTLMESGDSATAGVYRLTFATGAYFARSGTAGFYPAVTVTFEIADEAHHHVPLLLSPFGYSTYRGS